MLYALLLKKKKKAIKIYIGQYYFMVTVMFIVGLLSGIFIYNALNIQTQ